MKWILYPLVAIAGAIVLALFVFVALLELDIVPSSDVQTGAEVAERHVERLREAGVIDPTEKIKMIYQEGVISPLAGGSILTESRVIAYQTTEDGLEKWSIPYTRIESVTQTAKGTFTQYSTFEVDTDDEDLWLTLWLPHEDGDDFKFVDALREEFE